LESTGDVGGLDFKLHDFGNRGVSSVESAAIGGLAHLSTGALGTDTVPALMAARRWYGYKGAAGSSLSAMEHSTVTTWGRAFETDAYRNMLNRFGGKGKMFAMVLDSYDVFNAADNILGKELKDEIESSGSIVVCRPDSGDPVDVNRKLIEILGTRFGYTVNAKGFKVLNTVRLIQGDGVDYQVIDSILSCFRTFGWSADNIAFGMGGALLQKCDRDTLKFAQKCSSIKRSGKWHDVQKDPITDQGKKSFAGRVTLMRNDSGSFYSGREDWVKSELVPVFENGEVLRTYTLEEVRNRANS
jgi:nicotinamide phosphoribosyltransferase